MALRPEVTGRHGPLTVQATGTLPVNAALDSQSAKDLSRAELVAAPLTALILVAAFGSLLAAGLPLLVGLVSVAGTFALLRGLAAVTPVSVFAENITTLLGFGLAIDYSLFLVTRYREELGRGRPVREAIAASVSRAGRTVLFSALTVIASLAAMTVFPLYYLHSLAYAGIAVVALAAAASLLILPPVLAVAGHRIDRFDVFAPVRRRLPGRRTDRGQREPPAAVPGLLRGPRPPARTRPAPPALRGRPRPDPYPADAARAPGPGRPADPRPAY
jgi:putative drug exporter of the RND superfamily